MSELKTSMEVSAAGLKAQSMRMRIIAENIANQDSIASGPGDQPYQRKMVTFRNVLDRSTGVRSVEVDKVVADKTPFNRVYAPGHPSADAQGYITAPNVNGIIEATDMREAQRTYEANLSAIEAAKSMTIRTLDLLR